MSNDLVALLYLIAGVLFILALRGLSSPETSPGARPSFSRKPSIARSFSSMGAVR